MFLNAVVGSAGKLVIFTVICRPDEKYYMKDCLWHALAARARLFSRVPPVSSGRNAEFDERFSGALLNSQALLTRR